MKKLTDDGRQTTDDRRRTTTDAKWWQKLTLPSARWAKKGNNSYIVSWIVKKILQQIDLVVLNDLLFLGILIYLLSFSSYLPKTTVWPPCSIFSHGGHVFRFAEMSNMIFKVDTRPNQRKDSITRITNSLWNSKVTCIYNEPISKIDISLHVKSKSRQNYEIIFIISYTTIVIIMHKI